MSEKEKSNEQLTEARDASLLFKWMGAIRSGLGRITGVSQRIERQQRVEADKLLYEEIREGHKCISEACDGTTTIVGHATGALSSLFTILESGELVHRQGSDSYASIKNIGTAYGPLDEEGCGVFVPKLNLEHNWLRKHEDGTRRVALEDVGWIVFPASVARQLREIAQKDSEGSLAQYKGRIFSYEEFVEQIADIIPAIKEAEEEAIRKRFKEGL